MRKKAFYMVLALAMALLMGSSSVLAEGTQGDSAAAEEQAESAAVNISSDCTYSASVSSKALSMRLSNTKVKSWCTIPAGGYVEISWGGTVPVDFIYYQWLERPTEYTVETLDESGSVLSTAAGNYFWNDGLEVGGKVRSVRISSPEEMLICTLAAYSGGAPGNYHEWQPTPEKVDFMVIAMHPDDDCIFMGAIMPVFGAQQGYTGTILYASASTRQRDTEAANGAWTMGLRTYPLFAGLSDYGQRYKDTAGAKKNFNEEIVLKTLVQYLRQYQPEVVISHDVNGEYGHWQHKLLAAALQKAVVLAADETYDPDSAAQYGTWQVKKLYLHLYAENTIKLDVLSPLTAFDGKNAWEVAQAAYDCHKSQTQNHHPCDNEGISSLADFGLAFTTVGNDVKGDSIFENIPAESLVGWTSETDTAGSTSMTEAAK